MDQGCETGHPACCISDTSYRRPSEWLKHGKAISTLEKFLKWALHLYANKLEVPRKYHCDMAYLQLNFTFILSLCLTLWNEKPMSHHLQGWFSIAPSGKWQHRRKSLKSTISRKVSVCVGLLRALHNSSSFWNILPHLQRPQKTEPSQEKGKTG